MMFRSAASKRAEADQRVATLNAKLAAIDRSQAVIEFDLSGHILRANANFLDALGYTENEILGRHHSMFVSPEYADSAEYAEFWHRLNAGEFIGAKFARLGKGGRQVWIEAAYSPILGSDGKPIMVVKYATNITAAVLTAADHAGQVAAIDRAQAVISFGLDGTILSANENFLKTFGYTAAEILGRHHSIFVTPSFRQTPEYKGFWEQLGRGEFVSGEFKRIARDGRSVWIQATYNPILDPNGCPLKIVKFASDVTRMKERAADDAAQLTAIDKSQAVIAFDLDGIVLSANQNFLDSMGYAEAEVVGRHHSLFVGPEYAKSQHYSKFWTHLRAGRYHSAEFKRVRKDGSEIWLQASYNPIFDLNGQLCKVVKYATDITAEVMRRDKFNLLSLVADETDNSVVITDQDRRIIYVNRGFERLTGYKAEDVIGRSPGRLLQGSKTDRATVDRIRQKLGAGEPFYEEILNYDRNRKPYWISLAINPVQGEDGRIDRFISIQANVTATKQASLEFTTKLDAIGASNAMAEWTVDGAPVSCNAIIRTGEAFHLPLGGLLDKTGIAQVIRDGHLRREIAIPRAGQGPLWVDALFSVLTDLEGRPARILMCGSDIMARRIAVDTSINTMTEMMQRITGIVESISGFARQTNLLALNAAIEAARAQGSGAGFALIAKEIRTLSDEASKAIGEIDRLLLESQAQIASMASEPGGDEVPAADAPVRSVTDRIPQAA